jgi:hypothetical protein
MPLETGATRFIRIPTEGDEGFVSNEAITHGEATQQTEPIAAFLEKKASIEQLSNSVNDIITRLAEYSKKNELPPFEVFALASIQQQLHLDLTEAITLLDTRLSNLEQLGIATTMDIVDQRVTNLEEANFQESINGIEERVDDIEAADFGSAINLLDGRIDSLEASDFQSSINQIDQRVDDLETADFGSSINLLDSRVDDLETADFGGAISLLDGRVTAIETADFGSAINVIDNKADGAVAALQAVGDKLDAEDVTNLDTDYRATVDANL